MIAAVLFGAGFGFAAVVQPGPMQAYFLARVAQVGWRRTLPACLAPLASDGPIAALVLVLLRSVPPGMTNALQATGGVVLIVLALMILRSLRHPVAPGSERSSGAPHSLWQAIAVNIVNPGPYIGWSVILGPEVMRLWPNDRTGAIALVAAFYIVLTAGNALTIAAVGGIQRAGVGVQRSLLPLSACVLAALGLYRIVTSLI